MEGRQVLICNKRGLHARAAAKFVKTAEGFTSDITVCKTGEEAVCVPARSILSLMMLGADMGSHIIVYANGDDAEAAKSALAQLVEERFGEAE